MILPLIFTLLLSLSVAAQNTDEMWNEVSRTVQAGDFEGYAAVYHPDAVLVNAISGDSYPISEALSGWKPGFDKTAAGKMEAKVIFRFSERLMSESTSHETGIFRYSYRNQGQEWKHAYIHFQALSVKKDGKWLMIMEYQQEAADEEAWNELNNY